MSLFYELYDEKKYTYFNSVRAEILKLIKSGPNRILDIGCGSGDTGLALKKAGQAKEVFGVELVTEIALEAGKKLDRVLTGDIEQIELPFENSYFDYIIAVDVLEHLYDPWSALKKLTPFLKNEGVLIVSIPNVQNWRILRDLIFKGQWQYVEQGLLDKTHLRFFTQKTIRELLRFAGYKQIEIFPGFKLHPKGHKARTINLLTFGVFSQFWTHQYIATGRLS